MRLEHLLSGARRLRCRPRGGCPDSVAACEAEDKTDRKAEASVRVLPMAARPIPGPRGNPSLQRTYVTESAGRAAGRA